jgi:shikimate dehydrogenase
VFRCGVIGSPVSHSLSPRLQMAALEFLGLEGASSAVEDDGSDRDRLLSAVRSFDALSVTYPLKDVLFRACDETDEIAKSIGAVNTIRSVGSKIIGRNVDGEGFFRAITSELDVDIRDAAVTVIGAGGAARSIIASLLDRGVGTIDVLLRSDRGQLAPFNGDSRVRGTLASTDYADLVINATPVSLNGNSEPLLPVVSDSHTAFVDLSYEPAETMWMIQQRNVSPRVANGRLMLIWQAKLQLDWWFDTDVPITLLQQAVTK